MIEASLFFIPHQRINRGGKSTNYRKRGKRNYKKKSNPQSFLFFPFKTGDAQSERLFRNASQAAQSS
jgi:hypothetical protein